MLEWLTETVVRKIIGDTASSIWSRAARLFAARRFKQVFGLGVQRKGYSLLSAELALADQSNHFPYVKPEGPAAACFSINRPVSGSELRCVNYLAGAIGSYVGKVPSVRSDSEVRQLLDLDFIWVWLFWNDA
jgi:hypothetical protein